MKQIFLILIFLSYALISQGQPPPPTPQAIPIDGNLLYLALGGAFLAYNNFHKTKTKK